MMKYKYLTVLCMLLLTACENTAMNSNYDNVRKNSPESVETNDAKSAGQSEKPISTRSEAGQSRSLAEIATEQKKPKPYQCEEKFKNENGICEVPNQPHPKSLIKPKTKK